MKKLYWIPITTANKSVLAIFWRLHVPDDVKTDLYTHELVKKLIAYI